MNYVRRPKRRGAETYFTLEQQAEVLSLCRAGYSPSIIATRLQLSRDAILRLLRKEGLAPPAGGSPTGKRGVPVTLPYIAALANDE